MKQKNIQTEGDTYSTAELVRAAQLKLKACHGGITNVEMRYLGLKGRNKGWRRVVSKEDYLQKLSDKDLLGYLCARDGSEKPTDKNKQSSLFLRKAGVSEAPKKEKKKYSDYKDLYYDYLNSDQWRLMRDGLFYRRGKKCESCGSTEDIQVHHLHYKNVFKEKAEDLEILCRSCHEKEHNINQPEYTLVDWMDDINKVEYVDVEVPW